MSNAQLSDLVQRCLSELSGVADCVVKRVLAGTPCQYDATGIPVLVRGQPRTHHGQIFVLCWGVFAAYVFSTDKKAETFAKMVSAFRQRRDVIGELLSSIPGISLNVPDGAFYVFPDIRGLLGKKLACGVTCNTDDEFAAAMLEHAHIGIVSGSAFGAPGFVRMSYATSMELIREGVVASAHDVSEGGLFVTLLESAMAGGLGFDLTTDAEIRPDAFLFGEAQSRIAVSVRPEDEERFLDIMMRNGVEFDLLGHVTKGAVRVDDEEWGNVADYRELYDNALNFSVKA
jgi:hypothetical protein